MRLQVRKDTSFLAIFLVLLIVELQTSISLQYINKTGFRACVKELFVQQHDPLSVSYAVLPGNVETRGSA